MTDFDISITSHCNAACPSCKRYPDYGHSHFNPQVKVHHNLNQIHMNFDMFKKVIENNYDDFFNKVVTYEGELGDPMTHPKIKDFINFGCDVFKTLKIVTNGGNRKSSFYKNIGDRYNKLEMVFSIDGLYDDTNQIYRRKVDTEKAKKNMLSFNESEYGRFKTSWNFLIFKHNFFEIPEILHFSKINSLTVNLRVNCRPKFILPYDKINTVIDLYEKNKHAKSKLILAN